MTRLKFPGTFLSLFIVLLLTFSLSFASPSVDTQQSSAEKKQQSVKPTVRISKTIVVKKISAVNKMKQQAGKTKTVASKKKKTTNKTVTQKVKRKSSSTSKTASHKVKRKSSSASKTVNHKVKRKSSSINKKAVASKGKARKKKSTQVVAKGSSFSKSISARSAIIIDARSGNTLFAKSPDNPRQPASTIKILTGMIALQSLTGEETVPVSSWAAGQPRSKVDLNPKKHYQANDLINAVLLASANDASVALAEKIAGSESSFAKMMTERARLWGAQNTVCKTATGLTAKGQTSTARDLAVMFRHVMADPAFAARMKQVKVKTTFGTLLRNHNKALWQVEGTQGGKTGFTNAARQTYVGKFKRGDTEIVVAVMGCETMWLDVKKLVQHGFALQNKSATASVAKADGQEVLALASGANTAGVQE